MDKLFDFLWNEGRLIKGILFFLVFAYGIENDRDYWTWVLLLSSILNFVFYIINKCTH